MTCLLWRHILTGEARLYVGNLGDSRAILCRGGKVCVCVGSPFSSVNPHCLKEVGGLTISLPLPPSPPSLPVRQPVQLSVDHRASLEAEQLRVKENGGNITNGKLGWCLEVTRAFGDLALARFGLWDEPDIRAEKLGPQDTFLVMCSDGLSDYLSNDEIVGVVSAETPEEAVQWTSNPHMSRRTPPQSGFSNSVGNHSTSSDAHSSLSTNSILSSDFFRAPTDRNAPLRYACLDCALCLRTVTLLAMLCTVASLSVCFQLSRKG